MWLVMVTGLRRAELLGLKWLDVDLDAGKLTVRRNYIRVAGKAVEKDTKTHQMRRISLDLATVEVLTEHRQRYEDMARELGLHPRDDAYIVSYRPDRDVPYDPDAVTHRYSKMCLQLGIVSHLHALRHYSATELPCCSSDPTWLPHPACRASTGGPEVPDLLPDEDRGFGSGLFVDLVPSSCWFTNVRSSIAARDWERLRRTILRRADHRCEICGAGEDRDTQRRLEAHERWAYNENTSVQTLRQLICLCSDCHLATHFGYAQVSGSAAEAFTHLRVVTGLTDNQALAHIDAAAAIWEQRSARPWALDLTMLTGAGITIAPPSGATERAAVAEQALRGK